MVIEVRNVDKTFRIPHHRVDSLKERAVHPLTRIEYRELHALRDVSFDIHQGEFFGIVGRNGSGKSSLLKIMASIYRADGGRVRMAGRVAPFIELGVGFNPELTARENGVLNGVLMGLTRREARRRLDAMIEFAELEEFADLKLKNYSSGMMVRFAFSVMVQADADIMLIDEVLAVGDAAFAQKCMDVFHERRDAGKTIVLVTHDMATVQSHVPPGDAAPRGRDQVHRRSRGHRAALLPPQLRPERRRRRPAGGRAGGGHGLQRRVVEATLRDETGAAIANVEQDVPIGSTSCSRRPASWPARSSCSTCATTTAWSCSASRRTLDETVSAGQRIRLPGRIENRLVAGRYYLDCWVRQDEQPERRGPAGPARCCASSSTARRPETAW